MVKNILICGGYNWFGYELIRELLNENKFSNFIIIDSFQNVMWKENIKDKLDKFKYLFNMNIFIYSIDIKDNYKLEHIYNKHNITHVVNNIKYNILDYYNSDKIQGYNNIVNLNNKFKISQYICLYRYISHDDFALNNDNKEHVLISNKLNECLKKINESKKEILTYHINIVDYVYGMKKDKYNDILYILNNIAKSSTNFNIHSKEIGLTYDKHLLNNVKDILNYDYQNILHNYLSNFNELYNITKYYMNKEKNIVNNYEKNNSTNPLLIMSIVNI